jgi:hypothetical protein
MRIDLMSIKTARARYRVSPITPEGVIHVSA